MHELLEPKMANLLQRLTLLLLYLRTIAPTRADVPTAAGGTIRSHHAVGSITTYSLGPESVGLLMQRCEVARMKPRAVAEVTRHTHTSLKKSN